MMTDMKPTNEDSNVSTTIGKGGAHRFSDLSIALIKFCMQDGEAASKEISDRLSLMQSFVDEAKHAVKKAKDTEEVNLQLDLLGAEIISTVIALQFFDRISQRMSHAVESVEAIEDSASLKAKTIDQRFTMDDERILYEALLEGCTVDEALERASQKLTDTIDCKGSDIELF